MMVKKSKYALLALAALAGAAVCFACSPAAGPLALKLVLFVAGSLLVLGAFAALTYLMLHTLAADSSAAYFNLFMLVVSLTFAMLANFSTEIMGLDGDYDLIDTSLMFLLAFVFVGACSIFQFRALRRHADAFYTSLFTASFATISTLFYLFGPILPENDLLEGVRLFAVVGSLSLALSLFLIERERRRAQR